MTASIIHSEDLFFHARFVRHESTVFARPAREHLKEMALNHPDLTVANIAARLAKPVRNWTPPYSGDAA